jgi:hypothetical protein
MEKFPFNIYDFFAYLASGFIVLAAIDFAFDLGWLFIKEIGIPLIVFGVVAAYVVGHVNASLAGYFIETLIVRKLLHLPEIILFEDYPLQGWATRTRRFVFSGFYRPLTEETRSRVLLKAEKILGSPVKGRALFFHCHPIVKQNEVANKRLEIFLNLYGFCRNVSMACVLAIPILLVGAFDEWRVYSKVTPARLWWAVAAAACAIGMFFRYLKFFRLYTHEVYVNYAEIE